MLKRFLLTPGPTPVPPEVLAALSEPVIHHRAPRFTEILTEVVAGLKYVYQTANDVLVFAASGTGAMESAVVNLVNPGDTVIVASVGNFGEHAVGQSRHRVLLVHDQRPSQQPGRDATRTRREATRAQHHARPVLVHRAQRLEQRHGQSHGCDEQGREAFAAQAAHAQPLDRYAGGRHQPRLDAAPRAEPHDVVAALLQDTRGGERRENVPARAACHDEGDPRHDRRSSRVTAERPVICVS